MKKENNLYTGISEPGKVDAFLKELNYPLKKTVVCLRELIMSIDKKIGEGIYWNAPTFYYTGKMGPFDPKTYKRYIVGFNLFQPGCVRLIFLRGAGVEDKGGLLEGDYKDGRRIASFKNPEEVKLHEKTLKAVIRKLIRSIGD